MFDLFDVNFDGRVDGLDFLLLDTVLFPAEEEKESVQIYDYNTDEAEDDE